MKDFSRWREDVPVLRTPDICKAGFTFLYCCVLGWSPINIKEDVLFIRRCGYLFVAVSSIENQDIISLFSFPGGWSARGIMRFPQQP